MTRTALVLRLACALLVGAAAVAPRSAAAQTSPSLRFEITGVGDSTITFPVRNQPWVKPHVRGIAVDPRRRDMLIAQFEILNVRNGVATALITGATARVTTDHVAQVPQPERRWWRSGGTWIGMVLGLAAGVAIGASL